MRSGLKYAFLLMAWGSVLPASSIAVTYLDVQYGTPTGTALARAAAMGATGVSVYQGSQAVVQNPALLALEGERWRGDFAFGVLQASEDRLVPLFDSFNSFVDETTIAVNRNTYAQAQGGLLWRLPFTKPMTLSAGVFERFSFDYDYFEELRDPDFQSNPRDALLQNRTLTVGGRLRSFTAGYGAEVAPHVHLGLAVHRYFGDVELNRSVVYVRGDSSVTDELDRELDGWGWSIGAHGRPHERIDLGVSFEGPFTVDGNFRRSELRAGGPGAGSAETSSREEIEYPGTLRFGATYRPQNPLLTLFSVEFVRRFWENLDDSFLESTGDAPNLRDTWDFRVGLEHVFYNGLPLRFGFRYLENYNDHESERSIYSVGIGYRVEAFRFDVTGLYHRQTSRQGFLFDPAAPIQGGSTVSINSDAKVEDSVLQLVLGVSRTF